MNLSTYLWVTLGAIHACGGQAPYDVDEKRLIHRRPLNGGGSAWPCDGDYRNFEDPESRSLLAVLGGAAIGGVVGGAAGYHLGMKKQKPVIINNNVYNQLPSPCFSVTGGSGAGSGAGGGLLSNHPILSNLLGGIGNGIGNLGSGLGDIIGGGWGGGIASNRNIRQFNRQVLRPLSRLFK